jgi:hypothetical protein
MAAQGGETPIQKQLRIKTGVVARIEKELTRYHEELAAQRNKIQKMEENGEDEHDIRKQASVDYCVRPDSAASFSCLSLEKIPVPHTVLQKEVLEETETMIPDTMRRLNKSIEDLQEYIVSTHYCERPPRGFFSS